MLQDAKADRAGSTASFSLFNKSYLLFVWSLYVFSYTFALRDIRGILITTSIIICL